METQAKPDGAEVASAEPADVDPGSAADLPKVDIATAVLSPNLEFTSPSPPTFPMGQVLEEFAEDLNERLGRANGNVYHRKPGVEGVHDGQIMVRLKKKRFIVIDYNPEGGMKQPRHTCVTPTCNKVGVPVLMYDSNPSEPTSLYMRSGLCFTCQRALNEKRRTQRKRKSDLIAADGSSSSSRAQNRSSHGTQSAVNTVSASGGRSTAASARKRVRLSDDYEMEEISKAAIVVDGPVDGTRAYDESDGTYGFSEITIDFQNALREAMEDGNRLVEAVTNVATNTITASSSANHQDAVVAAAAAAAAASTDSAVDEAVAAAVAATVTKESADMSEDVVGQGVVSMTTEVSPADATTHHSTHAVSTEEAGKDKHAVDVSSLAASSKEGITAQYEKTMLSMKRGIYLLSQWKASWDTINVKSAGSPMCFQNDLVGGHAQSEVEKVVSEVTAAPPGTPSAAHATVTDSLASSDKGSAHAGLVLSGVGEGNGEDVKKELESHPGENLVDEAAVANAAAGGDDELNVLAV